MKILLINHYAGSPEMGMEFRPYYLAREWQKLGHEVLIVGGSFSHLRKKQPHTEGFAVCDSVHYYWIKTLQYKGNGMKRFLSMIQFTFKLLLLRKKFLKNFKPDVVVASSTYTIDNFAAKQIAKEYFAQYIYEIHDLWPLSPMELGGMSKYHPFIMLMQWGENFAYKHCNAVVSILPNTKSHCVTHGLDADKFYYVPNGIVEEDWENPKPIDFKDAERIQKIKSQFNFLVGYAGGHAISNALDELLEVAKLCNNESIAFILIGDGVEKERLKERVMDERIANVFFFDPIPKNKIPNMLSFMDALYIGWQKRNLYRFGISPNKLFDYMMAGKPIIQTIDAVNNIVEEAQCGYNADPENVESIKSALLRVMKLSEEERGILGKNGYQFVKSEHTYSVLSKRFLSVMDVLCASVGIVNT